MIKISAVKLANRKKFFRLLGKNLPGINLRSGVVVLKPGESVGKHITENKEEAIIILEGKARFFYAGKKSFIALEQSFIYVPPDTLHDLKNTGKNTLKYVYITSALR